MNGLPAICGELRSIFGRQSSAWLDRGTLERVRGLCRAGAESAAQDELRLAFGRLLRYAEGCHSHQDPDVDGLRSRTLLLLESIENCAKVEPWGWCRGRDSNPHSVATART